MRKLRKNRPLNSASTRLSGQLAGQRIYEQTRYKLDFLMSIGAITEAMLPSIDYAALDRLFEGEGHKLP